MVGLRTLEEELLCCPGLRKEDVEALRKWAEQQPHLPNLDGLPEDFVSVLFAMIIKRRYNSLERAKETVDNYFTFQSLVPELYQNRSTLRPEVQTYLSMNYTMMMDKRDSDGNIVLFQYLYDPDLKRYDFDSSVRTILMTMDSWFHENGSAGAPGVTVVLDQRNFSLSHVASVTLTVVKKLNHYHKDCAPISIKNIYVVHATNFIQTILAVVKPLVHGELFKRIRTFSPMQMEEFYKCVPKEAVPNEFGGIAGALEELNMKTVKRLERNDEIFRKLDLLHVDESKRLGPQKNANNMFGLEGSFKKLDVD